MKNTINLEAHNCTALSNDELVEIIGGSFWSDFKDGFLAGVTAAITLVEKVVDFFTPDTPTPPTPAQK
ncbi:MAG: hypothetical protein ACOVO2_07650 [Emticicia sp.]|uniref:hypothetical protein n=1 Tax=Emticicia sp. TaxID=1930953 RepID=UPI003BA5AA41